MTDETARSTWRREYDLVDDSTPEPVDPAPTSEDAPAVDPLASHRADAEATRQAKLRVRDEAHLYDNPPAQAAHYLQQRDASRGDADRLAAALRSAVAVLKCCDFDTVLAQCRAALARHQEPRDG